MDTSTKKPWATPKLTEIGTIEELTLYEVKSKRLGNSDDFGISGITNP